MSRATRGATRRALLPLLPLLLSLSALSCITRQVDTPILSDHENQISLRGYTRSGKPVDRGYNHPIHISTQRMSHVLGAVEVRVGDRTEHTLYPIVTGKSLIPISNAVSQALEKADSSQMIVVKAIRKNRRFGVFTRKHLTSFIVYAEGDYLNVKVSRIDWELPRDPKAKIPEPRLGEEQMDFRILPGDGMHAAGKQTVAARWRDPAFAKASRTFERDDSGARTRTVLMEESIPVDEIGQAIPEDIVDQLSPEQLRGLADLEELRRQGAITENEYVRQREELMGGAGR